MLWGLLKRYKECVVQHMSILDFMGRFYLSQRSHCYHFSHDNIDQVCILLFVVAAACLSLEDAPEVHRTHFCPLSRLTVIISLLGPCRYLTLSTYDRCKQRGVSPMCAWRCGVRGLQTMWLIQLLREGITMML
jgi:hypothetical protein